MTATDTANSAIVGSEENLIVQGGAAQTLKVTGFPTTETAGTPESFTVTAYDQYGNEASGYTGTVHFTSSDNQAVLPANATIVAGEEGTASFTATLETAGTQSITATDTTTSSFTGTESGIVVEPAAAADFTIAGFPATDTAGTAGHVTVTAYDAYGNVATGYTGTVELSSSDSQAVLPSDYTFTATDAGQHSFPVTLETAATQSITVTDTADTSLTATESGIVVEPAAVAGFTVAGFPTTDTAGTAGHVTVTARDAFGNVVTGYRGTVILSSSDSQAVLPPDYTFTAADAGQHTFSVTLKTAATQSIKANDKANTSLTGTESGIDVQAASAQSLTISGFPTTDSAGAFGNVTVTAYDAYGNVAAGYRGTVVLSSSDRHAVLPAEYIFTAADAGQHTFSVTLKTKGTQSITATDTADTSLTGTESGIVVEPAVAADFTVAGFPATDTAGTPGDVTITAYDAYGNVATSYVGTVVLSSSDRQAVLPPDYTFTATDAGQHTFSVTLETASAQSITATDTATPSLTGSELNIDVQPASAQTLKVTGFPTTDTAGRPESFTVTAYDQYGNVASGYTGTVHFTSSDRQAILPTNATIVAGEEGTASFTATLETAGTQSITATDTTTSTVTGVESGIDVQAASAQSLTISGFPATVTAGTVGHVTVTAYDAYGNVATGYTGTVVLSSSDNHAILPAEYTFTAIDAGQHTFSVTLETAATQSITATDPADTSLTGTESGIEVEPAAAADFTVNGFPATEIAGVSGHVTVTAYDAYGNVVTGYRGTVVLSSSDRHAVLPSDYAFTASDAGTHTFPVTLKTKGTQSIAATDTSTSTITGTESGVVVEPAAAADFTVSGFPATEIAGVSGHVTVTAYDVYGNVATGYLGTVVLTSSDRHAVLPAEYTFTAADAGQHTFPVTLETASAQSIIATDTATPSLTGTESGIVVSPAAPSQLIFVQQPASATAGVAIDPAVTVEVEDAFGNVVTSDRSTVTLTVSAGTFEDGSSTATAAASSGVATFNGLTIDVAGSYSLAATDGTLTPSGASNVFAVSPATASQLVVHVQPSATAAAGQAFGIQPVIDEEDRFGNLETGDDSTVVSASLSHGTGPLQGTLTATVSGGVATFTNLADDTVETIALAFQSGKLTPAASNAITITPAPATKLVVTTPPPSALVSGQAFTIVVSAEDPYGHVDPTFHGDVTISVANDPGFTTTVQAQNGVATFVGLVLDAFANGQAIRAVATGLSSATTNALNVTPVVPPASPQLPTILGEQVVMMQKRNKKDKPVGKPVIVGFTLDYSTAMNPASAGLDANYRMDSTIKKRVKKARVNVLKPVAFTSAYNPATHSVTLTIQGKQKFPKGGQIAVITSPPDGVASEAGVFLDASDPVFTILPNAKGITPG